MRRLLALLLAALLLGSVDLSGKLRRRNYGKGHAYFFGDTKVPGVTTVLDALSKPALKGWAAGVAADFVADNIEVTKDGHLIADDVWTELREISKGSQYPLPPKFSRTKLAAELKWLHNKRLGEASVKGTAVHALAERLANGEEVEVPEPLVGHVDSYLQFWEDWAPTECRTELSVGSRSYGGYGGQLDLDTMLPRLGRSLIDIKTSASGVYGDTALQIAGYRYAEVYLDEEGEEQPLGEFDFTGVLWVRADGYDLYPFDAGPRIHRQFLYLRQVWEFCRQLGKDEVPPPGHQNAVKGEALQPEKAGAS